MENPCKPQGDQKSKHAADRNWLEGCLVGILSLGLVFVFMIFLGPVLAIKSWREEDKYRSNYRRAKRLLKWERARQVLSTGKGTLIVAVSLTGKTTGTIASDVWWIEEKLREKYPECPLAPVGVLHPSFDWNERRKQIRNDDTERWWKSHSDEFRAGIFLVLMPQNVLDKWDEVLSKSDTVIVEDHCTYEWRDCIPS